MHAEKLDDLLGGVERSLHPTLVVRVRLTADVQRHGRIRLQHRLASTPTFHVLKAPPKGSSGAESTTASPKLRATVLES